MSYILVLDIGTSSIRASVVTKNQDVEATLQTEFLPISPSPGLVEFDPVEMAKISIDSMNKIIDDRGVPLGIGITNQRASTILWNKKTGLPLANGIGWQDLRTIGECLMLQSKGIRLAPNHSATKIASILSATGSTSFENIAFGTIDSWIVFNLTKNSSNPQHVSDWSNASLTGLLNEQGSGYDDEISDALRLDSAIFPKLVDSRGHLGEASALTGSPPILAILGDQQASLFGQRCFNVGDAKVTFGTGGMLDLVVGKSRPLFRVQGSNGTTPVIARTENSESIWAIESIMLTAGSCIEWLRDGLKIINTSQDSHIEASKCTSSDDVWFVPALMGLGAPVWDLGARGTLIGITRGTGIPQIARAVLEGIAHRGADLLYAAQSDGDVEIKTLKVDGGMSRNPTFVQALANSCQKEIHVSSQTEATTLGVGLLAGLEANLFNSFDELCDNENNLTNTQIYYPTGFDNRERWLFVREKALKTVLELSDINF